MIKFDTIAVIETVPLISFHGDYAKHVMSFFQVECLKNFEFLGNVISKMFRKNDVIRGFVS